MYKFLFLVLATITFSLPSFAGEVFVATQIKAGSSNQEAGQDANIMVAGDSAKSLYDFLDVEPMILSKPSLGGDVSIKKGGNLTCFLKSGKYGCTIEVDSSGVAFPSSVDE